MGTTMVVVVSSAEGSEQRRGILGDANDDEDEQRIGIRGEARVGLLGLLSVVAAEAATAGAAGNAVSSW